MHDDTAPAPAGSGTARGAPPTSSAGRGGDDLPLVVAQWVTTAALAWPGGGRWRLPWPVRAAAVLLATCSGGLAGRAAAALGADLTTRVEPRPDAVLRTTGPFAVSRHPVYTGLLGAAGGVAVLRRRTEPLLAAAALAVVLHRKAGREEAALRRRFGDRYDAYAAATPRLLGPL